MTNFAKRRFNIMGQPLDGWEQPHATNDFSAFTPKMSEQNARMIKRIEGFLGEMIAYKQAPSE